MRIGIGEFWNGDCLDVMKDIPDGYVDMIMCDLPYGTTQCEWDSVIPFDLMWKEIWRVCKDSASVVLTASQPFTSALVMSQIDYFRTALVRDKGYQTGFMTANKLPLKAHEDILVFYRKAGAYNPQVSTSDDPVKRIRTSGDKDRGFIGGSAGVHGGVLDEVTGKTKKEYFVDKTGYPTSIVVSDNTRYSVSKWHETQKPVDLFVQLISMWSRRGDLVLDLTAGSGTTAIASEITGRRWICIEKNRDFFDRAISDVQHYSRIYG